MVDVATTAIPPGAAAGSARPPGSILLVGPGEGGVAAVANGAAAGLAAAGWSVHRAQVTNGRVPLACALAALWRQRTVLGRADVVHVEFGALDAGTFWFAALAALRRRLVLVAHDAPRVALAPAAGILGTRGRWRRRLGYRVLSPLLDRALIRWVTWRSPVGVVFSAEARERWGEVGPRRIVVADHGASPPTPGGSAPSDGAHVLFAGFLGPSKGLDDLIAAWRLVGGGTRLPLVIAGGPTGEEGSAYVERLRAASARMPNAPRWLGHVADADFARLLADAAIVVMPYRRSNPVSGILVRAMVEGRAIVATRVPAALDAVSDGESGLLTPTGDPEALAAAIARLLDDPGERDRLGGAAASAAAARFTWRRHVDALEAAYALGQEAGG